MTRLRVLVPSATAVVSSYLNIWAVQADVTISNKPTQNMRCEAGVCTAIAKKAVLNVTELANMLASGDVSVKGGIAQNIDVDQPLSWSAGSRLTLDAKQSITINKPLAVEGNGALTIDYSDGGSGGDLQFSGKGTVDILNPDSSLVVNGKAYILVYDIATLANGVSENNSGNFALAANYDAGGDTYNTTPVPFFYGSFEGLGHTIFHFTASNATGLFGQNGGVLRDITLNDVTLKLEKATEAGALAGLNAGMIAHAHATGSIRVRRKASNEYVGGLVGENGNGFEDAIIEYSSANTNGRGSGGLVGWNSGSIDQCFASGKVVSGGGLVGTLYTGAITNSYALGHVTDGGGGLIGSGDLAVKSSYSAGAVDAVNGSGGFVGDVGTNAAQNNYWDVDTSTLPYGCGSGDCSGITGLSDAQLKSGLPAGFDPKIWAQDPKINHGYPYLIANPPQ